MSKLRPYRTGHKSRIAGVVEDATSSLLPGATVKLVNERARVTFTSTTSGAGSYVFEAVQPGFYQVDVEAPGFRTFASKANQITIG
jgi:hypothetical protein